MRKDNGGREKLKGLYYTKFRAEGLNLDRLINRFHRNGVKIYNAKKKERVITFTVKACDDKKVFAICNELCYNIKKVGNSGKFFPFALLYKNVGVAIGVLFFIAFAYFCSGVCLAIEFTGNGSVYSREVVEYLDGIGVKPFVTFSSFDLNVLEDRLLAENDKFSFASCERVGSRLKINLILANDKTGIQNGNITALYSNVDGIIESVKVYRGTAVLGVGDSVKKGDLIVDGYSVIKEEQVRVNVLATVSITTEHVTTMTFAEKGKESHALILAREATGSEEILAESVTCIKKGDNYEYTVRLSVRRIIIAG